MMKKKSMGRERAEPKSFKLVDIEDDLAQHNAHGKLIT